MSAQRVLHVYKDVYPPVPGGIERHIDAIRRAVPGRRHDVLVCAHGRRTLRRETPYGPETHVGQLGRLLSTPIAPTFPLHLRRQRAGAIVHLHMPNPTGEASLMLAGGDRPVVASYHCDIFRQRALVPAYKPLVVACLRRADVVVVGSDGLARNSPMLNAAGVATTLVPYAVDVERWAPGTVSEEDVAALRARHGGDYILAVGRLVAYKGFDRLIRLARRLTLPLVIVGDGPLRRELETLVRAERLGDRVHLAGRVSDDELAAHLAAAEIFVMASVNRAESFGVATLEAQAAGLPVVATDVGTGTSEAFAPGESGVLLRSDADEELVAALNELAAAPDRRRAMGEAGRRRVAQRNSLSALRAALESIYASVARE
jgi:glycosyltransferase involved in cell wall biosynthesis